MDEHRIRRMTERPLAAVAGCRGHSEARTPCRPLRMCRRTRQPGSVRRRKKTGTRWRWGTWPAGLIASAKMSIVFVFIFFFFKSFLRVCCYWNLMLRALFSPSQIFTMPSQPPVAKLPYLTARHCRRTGWKQETGDRRSARGMHRNRVHRINSVDSVDQDAVAFKRVPIGRSAENSPKEQRQKTHFFACTSGDGSKYSMATRPSILLRA